MNWLSWIALGISILAASFTFWQARESRKQAKAAIRQALASEEQVALMRQVDASAQISFVVLVRAITGLSSKRTQDGDMYFVDVGTSELEITVENTSTREGTVNHVGFGFDDGSYEEVQHLEHLQTPASLGPGRQLSWGIDRAAISSILDLYDEDADTCEIYFYVSQDPPFSQSGTGRRWESDIVTLSRPKGELWAVDFSGIEGQY